MSRAGGITDAELAALDDFAPSRLFSDAEKAALTFAEAITNSNTVPDEIFAGLRPHFSDDCIVELTATIAWEICAAKFNRAIELEAQGICPVAQPVREEKRS